MADLKSIKGLDRLYQKLDKLRMDSKRKNNGNVIVGYTAAYAVHVHEDLKARHKSGKTAKFLEKPARELIGGKEFAKAVLEDVGRGINLIKALLRVGLRLQRESQKIVPVDTSNLKGSAYTRTE